MHEKVPRSVGDMQNHPRMKKSADSGITGDSIRTKACPGKYTDFEPHLKTVLLRDTLFVPSNEIGWFQFPVSAMVSTLFSSKFRMMRVTEWSWEAYTPSTDPGMSRSFSFLFFSRNATLSKSTERNTRHFVVLQNLALPRHFKFGLAQQQYHQATHRKKHKAFFVFHLVCR